jgi:hypothetical protein
MLPVPSERITVMRGRAASCLTTRDVTAQTAMHAAGVFVAHGAVRHAHGFVL